MVRTDCITDNSCMKRDDRFILVVDSNANELYYTAMLLQRMEFRVHTCGTGEDAIDTVTVVRPALILTDLMLGDMDGRDLLNRIRAVPGAASLPIIGQAADLAQKQEQQYLQAGFQAIVRKPIQAEELYRIVQSVMESTPRRNIRIIASIPVVVNGQPFSFRDGECGTILSENGMYVRTLKPLPIKSQISIRMTIQRREITLAAEVLYSYRFDEGPYLEPGMGLRFVHIEPGDQEFIRQFIRDEITRGIQPLQHGEW